MSYHDIILAKFYFIYFSADDSLLLYNTNYSHTVIFHQEGSKSLWLGGLNNVLHFDLDTGQVLEVIGH